MRNAIDTPLPPSLLPSLSARIRPSDARLGRPPRCCRKKGTGFPPDRFRNALVVVGQRVILFKSYADCTVIGYFFNYVAAGYKA